MTSSQRRTKRRRRPPQDPPKPLLPEQHVLQMKTQTLSPLPPPRSNPMTAGLKLRTCAALRFKQVVAPSSNSEGILSHLRPFLVPLSPSLSPSLQSLTPDALVPIPLFYRNVEVKDIKPDGKKAVEKFSGWAKTDQNESAGMFLSSLSPHLISTPYLSTILTNTFYPVSRTQNHRLPPPALPSIHFPLWPTQPK